nr:PREDICTED: ATP-dependent 6-phosphofructokinase 7-like isoform X2 [Musa acuminata subsp. malaccensis]
MYRNPLQDNPAYSVVKLLFRKAVLEESIFNEASLVRGVYFGPEDVYACILTCGGLCPGLNTVIKDVVCRLSYMYGVKMIVGIQGGYRGFYARNTIPLTPKSVNDIHKRGGTILGTSRGGHDAIKIVDNIQDINQKLIYRWFLFPPVYIIGGDGTQKGAAVIF